MVSRWGEGKLLETAMRDPAKSAGSCWATRKPVDKINSPRQSKKVVYRKVEIIWVAVCALAPPGYTNHSEKSFSENIEQLSKWLFFLWGFWIVHSTSQKRLSESIKQAK
jgi:hypothetical protein